MPAKRQTVAALCHLLSSGDEADRCYASRTLGVLQDPAALPALITCLRDKDPDVCTDAADALGRIADPEAIPALLDSLENDPDGEVRTAVVEALGKITDQRVIKILLIVAVERPENLDWNDEWDDWWDMQLHAVKALGRKRAIEAIPVLQQILEDEESQGIETEVLAALAHIGGSALKILEQRLINGNLPERRRAATALGHAGSEEALALLGQALLDNEGEVRSAGIAALGIANAFNHLKVVLVSLKDPDPEVRNTAIETSALLASGAPHTNGITDRIAPLLDDRNPLVRATVIRTLGALATEQCLTPDVKKQICLRLSDPDTSVAAAACNFAAQHQLLQAKNNLLQLAANAEGGTYLRQQAIHALGAISDASKEVIDTLTQTVGDRKQPVRMEALAALMELARSDTQHADMAQEVVINALHGQLETGTSITGDRSEQSRITAGEESSQSPESPTEDFAMETTGQPATSTLEAINNSSMEAMLKAEHADNSPRNSELDHHDELNIPEEEAAELQEFINLAETDIQTSSPKKKIDVTSDIRHLSARVLATSNREKVVAALIECMSADDPVLRREAAISIGRIATHSANTPALQNAIGAVLTQLELSDDKTRHECARTLAKLGSAAAFPHLLRALEDGAVQVRIEAINGLVELSSACDGTTGTVSSVDVLKQIQTCLNDSANGVRLAAARGLASLLPHMDKETYEKDVVESIVATACSNNGSQAREMGQILKHINIEASANTLLQQLDTLQTSGKRRFVIELLEEIVAPPET